MPSSSRRARLAALACTLLATAAGAQGTPPATAPSPVRTPATAASARRVVIVVSSAGRDSGRTQPGFEMDELSQTWLVFRQHGYAVTIASPDGGAVVADKFEREQDYNAAFLADTLATKLLAATRRTDAVRAQDVDAVMVIGGKGAMFDLPRDPALARLLAAVHDRGGVVAAVCHGTAALLPVRTRDGRAFVAGRAMTGFSNEEEAMFGKQWRAKFPFLIEDRARELGARWSEAPLMMPHVVVDGRLVTGQNPFGTAEAAETVVRALGDTPVARRRWSDEAAVYAAVELARADAHVARRTLAEQWKGLKVEMIGLLGYYQLQVATTDADVRRATTLMELASPYMPAPQLSLALADGYKRLGRTDAARALATDVAARHAKHAAEARTLLASLPQ